MRLKDKIKFGTEIVKARLKDGYRVALSVYFFITYRCPLTCRYCNIINNAEEREELSTDKILNLIDGMANSGVKKLHLTGGEPMVRDDIGEIINRAKEKGMFVGLSSSGYFIPEKVEALKDIDIVFLSFDGEEEIHDYARGKGSYQKLMEAMSVLKSRKIKFWTTTVINKTNRNSIDFILRVAKEKEFIANFQILHSRDADYRSCFLSEDDTVNFLMNSEEVKRIVFYLIEKKKQGEMIGTSLGYLNHLLNWDDYRIMYKKDSRMRCWAGRLYCYLEPDGMLYPCATLLEQVAGQDAIRTGFKEAFNRLGDIPCQGCLSGCQTEQNLIFSLHLSTIMNWMRFI